MSTAIDWYDAHADEVAPIYEHILPQRVHAWLVPFLPKPPAQVLDVGGGTGRDCRWFHKQGYSVVCVEPSRSMRNEASKRFRSEGLVMVPRDSRLPDLDGLHSRHDLILLSAVWQHIDPAVRPAAFARMMALLSDSGTLAMTLRHGPMPSGRGMFETSAEELKAMAADHDAELVYEAGDADLQLRDGVWWTLAAVRKRQLASANGD